MDDKMDIKRVGVFSYLRVRCGLDNIVGFTIPDMVEWCGSKPDKRTNGNNDKFLNVVDDLCNKKYITYLKEPSKSAYMTCAFDVDYSYKECQNNGNGFAVVYLDELNKIMNYKKENSKDGLLTATTMLLVFAYLRGKIIRRPNKLNPENRSDDGIKQRRKACPDAYADSFVNMSNETGIATKTFIKAVDILEYELKLIVTDRPYRIKDDNGDFKTPYTIFANAYKREKKNLLITEDNYSRIETENKSELLRKYNSKFQINKKKRRS
jgi:uncharacterized protein (DUF1919 family)